MTAALGSRHMEVGIITFPTDFGLDVRDLGRLVEERGFDSLFFPEHIHIPAERLSPFPAGGELPLDYFHNLDPFVAHAAVASVTTRLRLGTGISLVAQREPISLAKVVATLDWLSGGRVILGVGAGWNVEEMRNHGVDPARRWSVVRDHVKAMRAIWTQDEATYAGTDARFERIWSWPKPVQRPCPPILVGGAAPPAFERVLDFGDGWMPALDIGRPIAPLLAQIDAFRQACRERGGPELPVTVAIGYGRPSVADDVAAFAAAGAARCLLWIPSSGRADTAEALDDVARLVAGALAGRARAEEEWEDA